MSLMHHAKTVPDRARRAHRSLVGLPLIVVLLGIAGSSALSVQLLRQNNLGMIELRKEVVRADAAADDTSLEQSLQALQHYVMRHMNTSTSIDLGASYQREVVRRQKSAASRLGNVNLYNQAERSCKEEEGQISGTDLADCITKKLSGASGGIVGLPSPALYRHSFVSPALSLDLAGFTLIIDSLFVYAALHQLIVYLVRRRFPAPQTRGTQE